jgi:hypothetical protein
MKTKETSTEQIYITVVTSGLTMLANKVARVLQPNEDIFDACSELANEIAKENELKWSNVLVQYFNHYSDEMPAMGLKVPAKPKSTEQKALAWWNSLVSEDVQYYMEKYFHNNKLPFVPKLTDKEIKKIWTKESHYNDEDLTDSQIESLIKPNQKQFPSFEFCKKQKEKAVNAKQFKTFDESLFKAYIDKFSNEDKLVALNILVCSIATTDVKFNTLLNQISNYKH